MSVDVDESCQPEVIVLSSSDEEETVANSNTSIDTNSSKRQCLGPIVLQSAKQNTLTKASNNTKLINGHNKRHKRFKVTPKRLHQGQLQVAHRARNTGKLGYFQRSLQNGKSSHRFRPDPVPASVNYDHLLANDEHWIDYTAYFYASEVPVVMTPNHQVTDKNRFKFRCNVCSRVIVHNTRASKHIMGHIFDQSLRKAEISSHTKCQICLLTFDTVHGMQTHRIRSHGSEHPLLCRICDVLFDSCEALVTHLSKFHRARDMPYVCELCNFRTSFHQSLLDHFDDSHAHTTNLLCPYCLRIFRCTISNSTGLCSLSSYYNHLYNHVEKSNSSASRCDSCRLQFLNVAETKRHRDLHHIGKNFSLAELMGPPSQQSLNVFPSTRDINNLRFTFTDSSLKCRECQKPLLKGHHFKKLKSCNDCKFTTFCSFAASKHMNRHHREKEDPLYCCVSLGDCQVSAQMLYLHCRCGYVTVYGDDMAKHFLNCTSSSQADRPSTVLTIRRTSRFPKRRRKKVMPTGDPLLDYLRLGKA